MYNYKIKFTKKPGADEIGDEAVLEMIENYQSTLSNNGQIIGGYDVFSDNGSIFFAVVLPEDDALSDAYCNDYVKKYRKKLDEFFDSELIRVGDNLEYYEPCACEKPSWYYLWSSAHDESPLFCGECRRSVPLYKIPYREDEKEHYSITSWQNAYGNMSGLWIHSLWDRFTGGQIFKHDSKLNVEGRELCADYEKKLCVPVYYYMDYHSGAWIGARKVPAVCPQCGGAWLDDSEFVRCEKCRLLADSPEWIKKKKSQNE